MARVLVVDDDARVRTVVARQLEAEGFVFLHGHPRRVFTRAQLLAQVWTSAPAWLGEATVTEHVHRLRHKLEAGGAAAS